MCNCLLPVLFLVLLGTCRGRVFDSEIELKFVSFQFVVPAKETVQKANIRRSRESRNPVKQPNPQGFSIYNAAGVLVQSAVLPTIYAKVSQSLESFTASFLYIQG